MKEKPLKVIAGAPDRPLVIGDIEIPCYVLENERRVIVQRGMMTALDMSQGTAGRGDGDRIARFLATKSISPFVESRLRDVIIEPIRFKHRASGGTIAYGYEATVLADICEAVMKARSEGVLNYQQEHIATRCEILLRGFAKVGIIALVDEATGYERIRVERALATILEKFIAKELQPWTRTFPYEFYEQIFRLKGWDGPNGSKRPAVIGHYTNDFVYSRLAPGVLDELKERTPKLPSGNRRNKYFQWFTPEIGHPKLLQHLAAVTALMRASPNWDAFKRSLGRAFPEKNKTIPLPFDYGNE